MDDGRIHNRSLGERLSDALEKAALDKAEAHRQRKRAERIFDIRLIAAKASSAEARKAEARTHPDYQAADDTATEAECSAIVSRAQADGLQVQFDDWRTRQATARAEMQLR